MTRELFCMMAVEIDLHCDEHGIDIDQCSVTFNLKSGKSRTSTWENFDFLDDDVIMFRIWTDSGSTFVGLEDIESIDVRYK